QQMQSRNWRPNVPQRRSVDRMTGGMYSDSEITTKPVFGNRQLYAHPLKDSSALQQQQQPQQHQHHRRDSGRRRSAGQSATDSGYREYQSETEGHRERERRDSYREHREQREQRDHRESGSREHRESGSREHRESGSREQQRGRDRRVSTSSGQHAGGGEESGEESETSTNSKTSVQSAFSTHSDRPRPSRTLSEFTSKIQSYGPVHPAAHPSRTSIAISQLNERERAANESKTDGSLSDTAIGSESQMEQLNVICNPQTNTKNSGLSKKSNSTSQLSVSGTKKRLGFRRKQATSFSVHRSEEV
ncbi:unnamed protein product, partial [Medioppia subpectinata]